LDNQQVAPERPIKDGWLSLSGGAFVRKGRDVLDEMVDEPKAKRKRPTRILANVRYYQPPPGVITAVAATRYDLKHATTLWLPDIPVWRRATWPRECGPAPLQVLALVEQHQNGGTGGWDLAIARESLLLPNPRIPDDVFEFAGDDIGKETTSPDGGQRKLRNDATEITLNAPGDILWPARPLKGLTRAAQRAANELNDAFDSAQQYDSRFDERWTRTPSPRAWFYVRSAARKRIEARRLPIVGVVEPLAYRMPVRTALEFYKEHTRAAQEIARNGRAVTSEWRSDWTGEYGREVRISHDGRILPPAKPASQWRARPLSSNPYSTSTKGIGTHQKGGVFVESANGKCRESLATWLARHPLWDFRPTRDQVVEAATSASSAAASTSRKWLNRKCFHWTVQADWNVATIPADDKPVARKVWTGDARRACVKVVCTSMGRDDHRQYCAAYARSLATFELVAEDKSLVPFDFNNPVGRKEKLRFIGKAVNAICDDRSRSVIFERKPGRKKKEKPKQPPKKRGRPPKNGVSAMPDKERKANERARKKAA
jgi:hypothetical protein